MTASNSPDILKCCTKCGDDCAADDGLCDDCAAEAEQWTCLDCGKPCEEGEDLCRACAVTCCPGCEMEPEHCVCEPVYEDEP